MSLLERLQEKLKERPEIAWRHGEGSIDILPASDDGFAIEVAESPGQYRVSFGGGWHEHFDDPDEALECVAFGLSTQCRLVEVRRGDTPCRWTVEQLQNDEWVPISTVGLMLVPFWRRKTVVHLRNRHMVEAPENQGD